MERVRWEHLRAVLHTLEKNMFDMFLSDLMDGAYQDETIWKASGNCFIHRKVSKETFTYFEIISNGQIIVLFGKPHPLAAR